jgi:hemoglobin-like flavoprotein
VLNDSAQIKRWLEDLNGRDMTHSVIHQVADDHSAAYTVACSYPDGTRVLCAAALELREGLIAGQTIVQAWDETVGDGASA